MIQTIPARVGMLLEGAPVLVRLAPGNSPDHYLGKVDSFDAHGRVVVLTASGSTHLPIHLIELRLDNDVGMQCAIWFLEEIDSPLACCAHLFERVGAGKWTHPSQLHLRGMLSARHQCPRFDDVFPESDKAWDAGAAAILRCLIVAAMHDEVTDE